MLAKASTGRQRHASDDRNHRTGDGWSTGNGGLGDSRIEPDGAATLTPGMVSDVARGAAETIGAVGFGTPDMQFHLTNLASLEADKSFPGLL